MHIGSGRQDDREKDRNHKSGSEAHVVWERDEHMTRTEGIGNEVRRNLSKRAHTQEERGEITKIYISDIKEDVNRFTIKDYLQIHWVRIERITEL